MGLAGGLGAMSAMAMGPDGFKWENMLKPESLIAGGIGAGAGYLGSKLMGDDEEDDNEYDPAGLHHHHKPSGGSSWLPALAGAGALGLGAYGLYNHFNPSTPAAPPATPTGVNSAVAGAASPNIVPKPEPPPPSPEALSPTPPWSGGDDMQRFIADPQKAIEWANTQGNKPATMFNPETGEPGVQGAKGLPGPVENMGKLVGNFHQSEIPGVPNTNQFPQLSDIYRRIYAGETGLLDKAKAYQAALNAANQGSSQKWPGLERLEAYNAEPDPNFVGPMQPPGFPIRNVAALGAYGFKDLNDVAAAAAEGDPRVTGFFKAIGPQDQRTLMDALVRPGYHTYRGSSGAEMGLPASAVNPRASALLGSLTAASMGDQGTPEMYDPKMFLQEPDQLRAALSEGHKQQLIQDLANPNTIAERFQGMSPEDRAIAARNLGGLLYRTSYGKSDIGSPDGTYAPKPVSNWIDEPVQQAMAKLIGNNDYTPVGVHNWDILQTLGTDSSRGLSPYADPASYRMKAEKDIIGNRNPNFDPRNIVLNRTPDSDIETASDWAQVLRDAHLGSKPLGEAAGPAAVALGHLRTIRPDLYNRVVESLQRDIPHGHWADSLNNYMNQPGLDQSTGVRTTIAGGKVVPAWEPTTGDPTRVITMRKGHFFR